MKKPSLNLVFGSVFGVKKHRLIKVEFKACRGLGF